MSTNELLACWQETRVTYKVVFVLLIFCRVILFLGGYRNTATSERAQIYVPARKKKRQNSRTMSAHSKLATISIYESAGTN